MDDWTYTQDGSAAIKLAYRALMRAYNETPCICGPLESSSVCDCTVASVCDAASALMEHFPEECGEVDDEAEA